MNTKSVGERSEAAVLSHLLNLGRSVCIPFGNNQRYDMVVDEDGRLLKAQVKTGIYKHGCVYFRSCSANGFTAEHRGYKGQADIFLVYCPQLKTVYCVPVDSVGETVVTLRVDAMRIKQKCEIRWAKDFEI